LQEKNPPPTHLQEGKRGTVFLRKRVKGPLAPSTGEKEGARRPWPRARGGKREERKEYLARSSAGGKKKGGGKKVDSPPFRSTAGKKGGGKKKKKPPRDM